MTQGSAEMTAETYTDQQATDEAVLLLVRKLRRLHPAEYSNLMAKLPQGARDALMLADQRADKIRACDKRQGVTRQYRDIWALEEDEVGED